MSAVPGKKAPPLPPRRTTQSSTSAVPQDPPPTYDDTLVVSGNTASGPWTATDNRSNSTDSLVPSESDVQHERRRLLLIYIHGFMGNEMSFRSFPAHVHHLLATLLAETHVVHTKVYPRYRSKRNISYARDDFSRWLEPHEDPFTDVVLLGHSMGGLLSAEVAIMPSTPPASNALKHRILGTINFDVPFLGMHPGIVKSGLSSIFMPSEETQEDKYSSQLSPTVSNSAGTPITPSGHTDTFWDSQQPDPNFNPKFNNDVVLPVRKGWGSALHFISKHSDNIGAATKALVSSHMEFGGAMANFGELKARYGKVRALEETSDNIRSSVVGNGQVPARVRFVNYWTASTGRPKKVKAVAESSEVVEAAQAVMAHAENESPSHAAEHEDEESILVRGDAAALVEEHSDQGPMTELDPEPHEASDEEDWDDAAESLAIGNEHESDKPAGGAGEDSASTVSAGISRSTTTSTLQTLPPIPDLPPKPAPLDVSYVTDQDTRKLVEKEHKRATQAYEQAVKDREKAIKDRAKLEAKQKSKAEKDVEREKKNATKVEQKATAERAKQDERRRKLEKKQLTKDLTQSEQEELRLAKEKRRMEDEGRRMRGERPLAESEGSSIAGHASDDDNELRGRSQDSTRETPLTSSTTTTSTSSNTLPPKVNPKLKPATKEDKPMKDRKFCSLPPRDSNGELDPCWVRVFMPGVDEVGAHCGLFFVDERYERLVGDVAERVGGWTRGGAGG
ncbi:hypothetical protein LTR62_005393 [Meristemomyces frigidus]|uniref:AB hydrolase-1 domain-containing protein n=1 Tax=Meristemomyces frigidus TaxID=1508187 RepID=A0AAN7TDD4_9PEZI|nr:hypothetical protein LTR62_005393 [Meristemomyces frigidus]